MSEHNKETFNLPDNIIDKEGFAAGRSFCAELDELEVGLQCVETIKLPLERQELYDIGSTPDAKKPIAETRVVSIVRKVGHTAYIAELFFEGGEIRQKASEEQRTMTPEGWFIPEDLLADQGRLILTDMTEATEGYLTPYDGPVDSKEESAMIEREIPRDKPLKHLDEGAVPDGLQYIPAWRSFEDKQNDRTI